MVTAPTKPVVSAPIVWSDLSLREQELPVLLRFPEDTPLTDKLLEQISRLNKPLQFERTAHGALVIMAPSSIDADEICAELARQVANWARSGIGGIVTGSSGGYVRGDGHFAAPDAAWTSRERRASMSEAERQRAFQPVCPNFVIEVRSGNDTIASQQRKMVAWIAGGTELGWLIVPEHETVYIYRADESVENVERPDFLSAEPVCCGLTVTFEYVWDRESSRPQEDE